MTAAPDHTPLIDEQLSAWLDDELPREELELLAARLDRSADNQARLARYSLISSSLRGSQLGNVAIELAALQLAGRVRAVLDAPAGPEERIEQQTEQQAGRMRKNRVLPYAMAAGVALIAVAFAVVQEPTWRRAVEPVPVAAVVNPVGLSATTRGGAVGQASLSSRRLTNYLVYHGEYSGLLSARVTESHIVNNSPYVAALQSANWPPSK